MNAIKDLLLEFARTYEQAITKINKLEDKSQKSAVNYQYANNIRHSLSHLCSAITDANSNPKKNNTAEKQLADAISHLKNLTTDSYEHIAGHSFEKNQRRNSKGKFIFR